MQGIVRPRFQGRHIGRRRPIVGAAEAPGAEEQEGRGHHLPFVPQHGPYHPFQHGRREPGGRCAGRRGSRRGPQRFFQERRRAQSVRWMWDLVNELIQRALREDPEVQHLAACLESEVQNGRTTAAAAAHRLIQALGLESR